MINFLDELIRANLVWLVICGLSCDSSTSTSKKFDDFKAVVKSNYSKKKENFSWQPEFDRFSNVRFIEFPDDTTVVLKYVENGNSNWRYYRGSFSDELVKGILATDSLNLFFLVEQKNKMREININSVQLIYSFDRYTGNTYKSLEYRYAKELNGLTFYYQLFSKPLKQVPAYFYERRIVPEIGGKLSDSLIYYYR
ncbi:MAG: hypothetical protein EOP04_16345 [Proteobacteria bacterium]|nr:MAG: hypothetical protein EOP04_16345 [Pseudomonadota bacterium]